MKTIVLSEIRTRSRRFSPVLIRLVALRLTLLPTSETILSTLVSSGYYGMPSAA